MASERIDITQRLQVSFPEKRRITSVRDDVVGDGGGGGPASEAAGPAQRLSSKLPKATRSPPGRLIETPVLGRLGAALVTSSHERLRAVQVWAASSAAHPESPNNQEDRLDRAVSTRRLGRWGMVKSVWCPVRRASFGRRENRPVFRWASRSIRAIHDAVSAATTWCAARSVSIRSRCECQDLCHFNNELSRSIDVVCQHSRARIGGQTSILNPDLGS